MPPRKPTQQRPNPLRDRKPITTPLHRQAVAKAARLQKPSCPNKQCETPDIQDGICHGCGTIIDDSNIVSEIQFGESSSGAAVVQGSFVGADQGTARSLGPAFKRAGGMEDRESTVKEGRRIMQSLSAQLGIVDNTMTTGVQIFKLAAMNNFIQGRRMEVVSAVCLYSACRKNQPCKVMLIDFADKVQVNVFKLGRTFKALHRAITISSDGIMPILPEDLIWRFCSQLEFGTLTNKVAEDAIRMAQRMSLDWMVMGRRPSGVCGACIILAARMNNFRRTVTEVVYIVKVTTNTIQKRLEEFKITPSSALTVDEFLNNEFLESAHDPPSFYEKTEEFQKTKKKRKRRHMYIGEEEENEEASRNGSQAGDMEVDTSPNKPQNGVAGQSVELRKDSQGFAIPPKPTQSHDMMPIDPTLLDAAIDDVSGMSFEKLISEFGDAVELAEVDEDGTEAIPNKKIGPRKKLGVSIPDEWQKDEEQLAKEVEEIIFAPSTAEHARNFAATKATTQLIMAEIMAKEKDPKAKDVSMDVHIGEDEFKDDVEVLNCLLSPADVVMREKLWINENKDWLRKQQLKEWKKRQEENGPPKARRNRKKKPRIGEGQTEPANSPAEAAQAVIKARSFSKKINYEALNKMFEDGKNLKGQGSAATSRTSRAGSEASESVASSVSDIEMTRVDSLIKGPQRNAERYQARRVAKSEKNSPPLSIGTASQPMEVDDGSVDDDYVRPTVAAESVEETQDDWRAQVKNANRVSGEDEEEDVENFEEDYGNGDIDDEDAFQDTDVIRGFGDDDNEDYDE